MSWMIIQFLAINNNSKNHTKGFSILDFEWKGISCKSIKIFVTYFQYKLIDTKDFESSLKFLADSEVNMITDFLKYSNYKRVL